MSGRRKNRGSGPSQSEVCPTLQHAVSRTGVGCLCLWIRFTETRLFTYILSMAAFIPQQQRWVVAAEMVWPTHIYYGGLYRTHLPTLSQEHRLWCKTAWLPIPISLFPGCVIWTRHLTSPCLHFLICILEITIIHTYIGRYLRSATNSACLIKCSIDIGCQYEISRCLLSWRYMKVDGTNLAGEATGWGDFTCVFISWKVLVRGSIFPKKEKEGRLFKKSCMWHSKWGIFRGD